MAGNTQKVLEFGQWSPDLASIGVDGTASEALNVYPRKDGFGPFADLQSFTTALPAACRGFFFARKSDGSIAVFAGTSLRLYELNNSTFTWTDVSKGGVAYGQLVSTDNWQFAQYADFVIATQVNTVPQKFVLTGGVTFVDLAGTPPAAGFVSIIGFFVVLSGLLSNPRRIQWSDLGAPETWTAGVGLSDFQDMSDGGNCINLSGGDAFGVIFQQESIRSITYAPGSAVVFQIARISTQETLFANNSIINVGDKTFYCGAAGFKMIVGSGMPQPIGKERVDRWFFDNVDRDNLQLVIGASDPTSTRVYWALKTTSGASGAFDQILLYDYALNQWAHLKVSGQWLGSLARPGATLEQMDAIASDQISVTGTAAGVGGRVRLTISGLTSPLGTFTVTGQNFIVVQGVVGTTEANGTWAFNTIDATHIDLIDTFFASAYVSGGKIGGSIDTISFSFDAISEASVAQLGAVDSLGRLSFFTGSNLEAILETSDGDPQGQTVEISGARPVTDCATGYVSIGTRMSAADPVVYSDEFQMDDQGWCEAYVETRFARGRLRLPAGATWSYAQGIQPDVSIAGDS